MTSNGTSAKANGKAKTLSSKQHGKVDYRLDLSEWTTFKPFAEFTAKVSRGNMMEVVRTYTEIVPEWSLDGDPSDIEAWLALPPKLVSELNTEIQTQIINFFQG